MGNTETATVSRDDIYEICSCKTCDFREMCILQSAEYEIKKQNTDKMGQLCNQNEQQQDLMMAAEHRLRGRRDQETNVTKIF